MVTLRKRPPRPKKTVAPKRASRRLQKAQKQATVHSPVAKLNSEEQRLLEWNQKREKQRVSEVVTKEDLILIFLHVRTKQKHSQRKATAPLFLTCPLTNQQIWFKSCTKTDLEIALERGKGPNRLQLVTIASSAVREEIYRVSCQAVSKLEALRLPKYGRRPWTVNVKITDPVVNGKQVSPLFVWNDTGRLQLAALPTWVDRTKHSDDITKDIDEAVKAMIDFDPDPVLTRMAHEEKWRVPFPVLSIRWSSPLHESITTRKAAAKQASALAKQDVMLTKYLHGIDRGKLLRQPLQSSLRQVLKVGKIRFLRDGLWVVGQEEAWHSDCPGPENTAESSVAAKPKRSSSLTPLSYFLQCRRKEYQRARLDELRQQQQACVQTEESVSVTGLQTPQKNSSQVPVVSPALVKTSPKKLPRVTFTVRQAEHELRRQWREMSREDQKIWEDRTRDALGSTGKTTSNDGPMIAEMKVSGDLKADSTDSQKSSETMKTKSFPMENEDAKLSVTHGLVSSSEHSGETQSMSLRKEGAESTPKTQCSGTVLGNQEVVSCSDLSQESLSQERLEVPAAKMQSLKETEVVSAPSSDNGEANEEQEESDDEDETLPVPVGPSSSWCLTPDQVQLCHEAGLEHYDRVLETVRCRDLWRELQDGFDVLRERGKGRYDMELPAFEEPQFSFLADIRKAPWMPVVREILGKDVVLIHKGMFLSLPGAEQQVYHQDGPHLTTQYQKPCHAINVFIPLIDLKLDNGPTEFCLGSHILGQEDWDCECVDTPLVSAGTPVIFDYRLGHNGLKNSSDVCRPIVYCTYAAKADGKEFRDSVNFSSRRYHKIGGLVSKVRGRDDRAKKRMKVTEEDQLQAVLLSSAKEAST